MVDQPPSWGGTLPRWDAQGRYVDALRPACASWMPGTAPCPAMNATIGAQASRCSSVQMPVSSGEMRPCADTAVASVMTRPAPPTARLPRWTRRHVCGSPSIADYWHLGDNPVPVRDGDLAKREGAEEHGGLNTGCRGGSVPGATCPHGVRRWA